MACNFETAGPISGHQGVVIPLKTKRIKRPRPCDDKPYVHRCTGPALRSAAAVEEPGLLRFGHPRTGPGDWGQHGHLQRREFGGAAATAVPGCDPDGCSLGKQPGARDESRGTLRPYISGLAGSEPVLRGSCPARTRDWDANGLR